MKPVYLVFSLALAGTAAATTVPPATKLFDASSSAGYDQIIVSYRPGSTESTNRQAALQNIQAVIARLGLDRTGAGSLTPGYVRKLATGGDLIRLSRPLDAAGLHALMQQLARDPAVEYVEPNRVGFLRPVRPSVASSARASSNVPATSGKLPSYLSGGPGGIRVEEAWKQPGADGHGVVVAVLDSGVTRHPDLGDTLRGYNFYVDGFEDTDEYKQLEARHASLEEYIKASNAYRAAHRGPGGMDPGTWCPDVQNPKDLSQADPSNWHGTAVSGIISGKNDPANGVAGIAPQAVILPARVLGKCGQTTAADVADAIMWAAGGKVDGVPLNPYPASVINLSLTLGVEDGVGAEDGVQEKACAPRSAVGRSVAWALAHGSTVVVAAGNQNKLTDPNSADDEYGAPANCPGVVTVGATGPEGKPASYSPFGPGVTLAAPGGDRDAPIRILNNEGKLGPERPSYINGTGTSLSAPVVSGVVALMISARRQAGLPPLSPAAIRNVLIKSARPIPAEPGKPLGAGLVDAGAAVREALKASPDGK
jgi:serine protease